MEIFIDIPGYEGAYQASSLGNIKSVSRYVSGKGGGQYLISEKMLKPTPCDKHGHVNVGLWSGGKRINRKVHALVALAFLGPRPENALIRHLDGNPLNNAVENLSYGSRYENVMDVYRIGKAWKKLTTDDVLSIRALLEKGLKQQEIAYRFNVSPAMISAIHKGKAYAWL